MFSRSRLPSQFESERTSNCVEVCGKQNDVSLLFGASVRNAAGVERHASLEILTSHGDSLDAKLAVLEDGHL